MGVTEKDRAQIGVWLEMSSATGWTAEGMIRLLGFLIEGAALSQRIVFRIVVLDAIRSAAAADLSDLRARLDFDYTLHSPADAGGDAVGADQSHDAQMSRLASFANENVPVDGWLILFPHFDSGVLLNGRKVLVFPDAIPCVFPVFEGNVWAEEGGHRQWLRRIERTVLAADRVITFSEHVAKEHAVKLFGVSADDIDVIPHALPDLGALLPFVTDGARTVETTRTAAGLLRAHFRDGGNVYLSDFPFEEVNYVAVSTKDRVTKNMRRVVSAVENLLRKKFVDIKLFTTAEIPAAGEGISRIVWGHGLEGDVVSMPELPRDVHAAFFHCAALTVHPSFFEGGSAPFPFGESVSVGTPCIMAEGPHTRELAADYPQMGRYMFDPYDGASLEALIEDVLARRPEVLAHQRTIYEQLMRASDWERVALSYARSVVPDFQRLRLQEE